MSPPGASLRAITRALPTCVKSIADTSDDGGDGGLVVRIGAHLSTWNRNDPFHHINSSAMRTILVEPQPRVYAQLRQLAHDRNRYSVINAAACATDGEITFYSLNIDPLSGHATSSAAGGTRDHHGHIYQLISQLASTSREHITKHQSIVPASWHVNLTDFIVPVRVPCYTLKSLLERASFADHASTLAADRLLVLTVDAEGEDDRILHGVDWSVYQPRLLVFEQAHINEWDRRVIQEAQGIVVSGRGPRQQ